MSILTELDKVLGMLYDINDTVRSNCGDEAYYALRDAIESVRNAWNVCKRGQEAKLENAYKDPVQSSKKPIKSADKHFNYDEYFGDIYDSDRSNADNWSREEYNDMVETARGIFYPAVQKAANACHFTVSDNEAEYVAEKCVRCFFDNSSWDEAVNRPEEYYVNSSRKLIKSDYHDKEIYRQAFGALLEDYAPEGDFPGGYRVLVDGNYETEFSANSREEAIKKFKDYFANKKKGINNSKKSIKSGSMSGWFGGICDKCKQYTNVHYVGYNGRKLCMRCSRGR